MARKTHEQLKKLGLKKPAVRKAYEELSDEFALLEELVRARLKAGKTQAQIAKSMHTSTSVVGRLESGGGQHKHSPTVDTLRRYARALGGELQIRLSVHAKAK